MPGPGNTWTIQMTLHDNIMVTGLEKSSLAWGADPKGPERRRRGSLIWDISDPINPRQLSHWKTGSTGTAPQLISGRQVRLLIRGCAGL